MSKIQSRAPLILVLFCFAIYSVTPCFADAGTPLMLGMGLHAFVGNFFIAILEAALVARIHKIGFWRPLLFLTMANYFSFFTGIIACIGDNWLFTRIPGLAQVQCVWIVYSALLFSLYLYTIFIEWPFVYCALPKDRRTLKSSLKTSAVIQTVSYLLLIAAFVPLSNFTLVTKSQITPNIGFSKNKDLVVCFIKESGKRRSLWKIKLDGSPAELLLDLKTEDLDGIGTYNENGNWYLCSFQTPPFQGDQKFQPLFKIAGQSGNELSGYTFLDRNCFSSEGKVMLAAPDKSNSNLSLSISRGFYSSICLTNKSENTDEKLGLEAAPMYDCNCAFPTRLPNDQAIFQLSTIAGEDVVLYDLGTRQMSSVAEGKFPLVITGKLEKIPAAPVKTLPLSH